MVAKLLDCKPHSGLELLPVCSYFILNNKICVCVVRRKHMAFI